MADLVANTEKQQLSHAVMAWARRLHSWLMTDDALAAEISAQHTPAATAPPVIPAAAPVAVSLWQADMNELQQIMWGQHWHLPMADHMTSVMVRAFGLNKEMSVLDLNAGFGGAARQIHAEYGSYVTGLEPDATAATSGMQRLQHDGLARYISLTPYDPAAFRADKHYAAIIANEIIYRVPDQKRFIAEIADSLKQYGHFSWVDFTMADAPSEPQKIEAWLEHAQIAAPPKSIAATQTLIEQHHFDFRISEDRTSAYAHAILTGLDRLMHAIEGRKIAPDTKRTIMTLVNEWAHRLAALSGGMQVTRFYAIKK